MKINILESRILIVDNNVDIVDLLRQYLNELGYTQISTATSVESAKQILSQNNFEILFLDWLLEDGNCFDVINFINKQNAENFHVNKNSLKIAVTGKDNPDDIALLKKYNIIEHFIKPFTADEFKEKFINAIKRVG